MGLQNIALLEYCDDQGKLQLLCAISRSNLRHKLDLGHSERRLHREVMRLGIPASRVTRIYSELAPCSHLGNISCSRMIAKHYSQAKVTYSFEYGEDMESRDRGVDALEAAVATLGARVRSSTAQIDCVISTGFQ